MAVQALGDTDLIQSLGLEFMRKKGIVNIWTRIPPEKQTLYQCAYEVIKAANDLKEPDKDSGITGDSRTWWMMGHAHKLLSCIESMAQWMKQGDDVTYTVYVVQKISDWFAEHGWEHLKAPLSEILMKANEYHDAGIKLRMARIQEGQDKNKKEMTKNGGRK